MTEKDPNGLTPKTPGAKLDHGKPKVMTGAVKYFPRALLAVAAISELGAEKYLWDGWLAVENGIQRYDDAEGRHITGESIDGIYDPGSHYLHAAHRAWNSLAYLELLLKEGHALRAAPEEDSNDVR